MVQRIVSIMFLLPAVCLATTSDKQQAKFLGYLQDLNERTYAIRGDRTSGYHAAGAPLKYESNLQIVLGTNTEISAWTNQTTLEVVHVTNYVLTSAVIRATNMIAITPTNYTAKYPYLPKSYTQSYVSADIIAESDRVLFTLIDSGLWVDTNAIQAAGGWSNYFATYTSTNWYWVDTDSAYTGIWTQDFEAGWGDIWDAYPQHPAEVPILTRDTAWAAAGLERVPTYVSTNISSGSDEWYGYQYGNIYEYSSTGHIATTTNWTYYFEFPRAPTNKYRAEIAKAVVMATGQHAITNIVSGVTNVTIVYTTELRMVSAPMAVPRQYIPPRFWSGGVTRAIFTLPFTNLPLPPTKMGFVGDVLVPYYTTTIDEASSTTNAHIYYFTGYSTTSWVEWSASTNGVMLSNALCSVASITSDYGVVMERSDASNQYRGATVDVVYSNEIATIGSWVGFHSPITEEALSNRIKVLSYLSVLKVPIYNTNMVSWAYNETRTQPTNIVNLWRLEVIDGVTTENGTQLGQRLCDEITNHMPFVQGNRTNSFWYPAVYLAYARVSCSSEIEHKEKYDTGYSYVYDSEYDVLWVDVDSVVFYPYSVEMTLTNLHTNLSYTVELVGAVNQRYAGQEIDPVAFGCYYYWRYYDATNRGWAVCYDDYVIDPGGFHVLGRTYYDTIDNCEINWTGSTVTTNNSSGSNWWVPATNRLIVLWSGVKTTTTKVIESGYLTSWPTNIPPYPPFVADITTSSSKSESSNTCSTSWSIDYHKRDERMSPSADVHGRYIDNLQLLFFCDFTNRASRL